MYAKVGLKTLSAWWFSEVFSGRCPNVKRFLKEVGAETFQENRKNSGLMSGWIEVPQGSCITLKLH